MDADQFSRIDKFFVDSTHTSPTASRARRAACRLDVICGPEVRTSRTAQAAALTALECAQRCFPGSVRLLASRDVRTALFDVVGKDSHDSADGPARYVIVVGTAEAPANALRATFDGWTACVLPVLGGRMLERDYCPLAGVLAGALAVSEVFLDFAAIEASATRRRVTLSLWEPWSKSPEPGPELRFLPARAWLVGLGHLGQAYAWAYSWLPFLQGMQPELWLVDNEQVAKANLETGLLSTQSLIGEYKTRALSTWLKEKGIRTRIIERRIDATFKVTGNEPRVLIGGVDDNRVRHLLAESGGVVVDAGIGNRADNFDTIALRTWPNSRPVTDLWPADSEDEDFADRLARENPAYESLADDECGRVRLAERSVGIPFVGATAASLVWGHILRELHQGAHVSELKVRLASPDQLDAFHRPSSPQDVALFEYVDIHRAR